MGRHGKHKKRLDIKKKIIIGIVTVGVVVAAGVVFAVTWLDDSKKQETSEASEEEKNNTQNSDGDNSKESEAEEKADGDGGKSETAGNKGKGRSATSGSSSGAVGQMSITIPFRDDSSGIEIERIDNYSGYYIEDGTEDEVDSVAAVTLKNNSDQAIEYGSIRLSQGEQTLEFQISLIPAGAQAVVMEANRNLYDADSELSYEGSTVANIESMDMAQNSVSVTTGTDGGITVTNIGQSDIPELRVFYKNLLDDNVYMGGIAYNAKIEGLKSGESRTIYPSHYDPEHGEIMMIRTYQ